MPPVLGRLYFRKFGARYRLAPHSDCFSDDLDSGMFGEDFFCRLGAERVDRSSGHAGDSNDIPFTAELFDQPFGRLAPSLFLINVDIVGARFGDLGVIGENLDALIAGALDTLVQGCRWDWE